MFFGSRGLVATIVSQCAMSPSLLTRTFGPMMIRPLDCLLAWLVPGTAHVRAKRIARVGASLAPTLPRLGLRRFSRVICDLLTAIHQTTFGISDRSLTF